MVQFAEAFPDEADCRHAVATIELDPLSGAAAAQTTRCSASSTPRCAASKRWSVRTLRERIDSHALRAHGAVQAARRADPHGAGRAARQGRGHARPWCSRTPMCWTSWACDDRYLEKDLEDAILREIEALPAGAGRGLRLRRAAEAHPDRRRRLLHRPAVLQPPAAPSGGRRAEARRLQGRVQGPDGAVPALAGQARAGAGRGAAAGHHPVHRQEAGAGRVAGAGQVRHPRRRVPDGAAAARSLRQHIHNAMLAARARLDNKTHE